MSSSTLDILTVIQNLRGQGIAITIEGVGTIRDDMMGSLTMNLLASFAEFERALIIDRTQSGRKRAIASSVRMGKRRSSLPQLNMPSSDVIIRERAMSCLHAARASRKLLGRRHAMSLAGRQEAIRAIKGSEAVRSVARRYGVAPQTIYRLLEATTETMEPGKAA